MKEGRRKSHLTFRGTRIRITLDFFQKSHKQREWNEIFSIEGEKNQPRILYPAKISFKSKRGKKKKREIKTFSDK